MGSRFKTLIAVFLAGCAAVSHRLEAGCWPQQSVPAGVVRTTNEETNSERRRAVEMMVQSVAGLAARAVNARAGDELVWVVTNNVDEEDWFARWWRVHAKVEHRGEFEPWALVDRYAARGIIHGYVLYRADTSRGEMGHARAGMDRSVNVATSLAGILGGIIIDESLEAQAQAHGLKLLLDARGLTPAACFAQYRERFTRKMLCTQDPRNSAARDLAIAQGALTLFGDDEPLRAVLEWLEPSSPILGWNGGDERKTTEFSSRWGHIQTATDWCANLPVLMAGSAATPPAKAHGLDPRTIDWSDARSAVSFVSSDGDNVQWYEGNFFRSHEGQSYWGSAERGTMPFGWSCCFAQLAQLCPAAIDYATSTQSANDAFIEWGGGYYFPDLFARDRPDRWKRLAAHARQTFELMQQNNTRVIGFNVTQSDSADALQAYRVFAGETTGLLAIFVYEYDRYEAGAGRVFWVKDKAGVDVPVITARYVIWNHLNERPHAGTPAKVAREIAQTVATQKPGDGPRYDWAMVHVWSWFRAAPGRDENAEDMPQENAESHGGERGYAPVVWCAKRLPETVRVVRPEELIWRLRMQHDAAQTRRLIETWVP